MPGRLITAEILGTPVAVSKMDAAVEHVLRLAADRQPGYICFTTAHMLVLARGDQRIRKAYGHARLIMPDGTPVVWCLRLLGNRGAQCISGPRTFTALLRKAAGSEVRVGFYGGRPETLGRIRHRLESEYAGIDVRYMHSPPFRPLTEAEKLADLAAIRAADVQMLFVGLGSPKQELWMHEMSPHLTCVLLGVGAAFEFYSGEKIMPPLFLQRLGLAGPFRMLQEPRRLTRRNLFSLIFAAYFAGQWIRTLTSASATQERS